MSPQPLQSPQSIYVSSTSQTIKSRLKILLLIPIAIVIMIAGGVGLFISHRTTQPKEVSSKPKQSASNNISRTPATAPQIASFAECKAAFGSKLSTTTPQQCTTSSGQTFTDTSAPAATTPPPSTTKPAPVAVKPSASSSPAGGSGSTSTGSGGSSSGGQSSASGLNCTNPAHQSNWPQEQYAGWQDPDTGVIVGADVMTGSTGSNFLNLNICSTTNWNAVANFASNGGSINAYPDTEYDITGDKTIAQYNSMQTCFGEKPPTPSGPQWPTPGGSEWDYAYDVWINKRTGENTWSNDIEIMVWNDWTDDIYPPDVGSVANGGSRTVTIDGVAYHMFQGGGANEWIYTRDVKATSGCFDMLNIMKDLAANESTAAGITTNSAPQHLEYGVEIASTYGTQTFQITNASLTVK